MIEWIFYIFSAEKFMISSYFKASHMRDVLTSVLLTVVMSKQKIYTSFL